MAKYCCSDCGKKFEQESHHDSHKKRKIPCIIKDKSLNDYIETKIKEEVTKTIKSKEVSDNESDNTESEMIDDNNSSDDDKKREKKQISKVKKTNKSRKVIDEGDSDRDDKNHNAYSNSQIDNKPKKQKDTKKKRVVRTIKKKKISSDDTSSDDNISEEQKDRKKVKKQTKKRIDIDDSYLRNPTNEVVYQMIDEKNREGERQYVLSKIKQAHQVLYEAENIEGENAMNDIMNLIFLRLIQDKLFDKEKEGMIDLFNTEYYPDYTEDELVDIFKYFKLEELSCVPLGDLRSKENNDVIRQMGYILKKHPVTSQIFLEENFLRTEKSVTLQHLIKTMFIDKKTKWDVKKMYDIEDLVGEIFESFINGYTKTNSKLSQFFTPRNLMNLILSFLKKDLIAHIEDNDDYHVADFCMGTAGWLVIFYNLFKEEYGDKIKLSGGEVKPNTFQYALMNIITTTNSMPYYIQRENSLTHIDKNKYHLILTNPPFKTDFKFDNIKKNLDHDQYTKENGVKLEDVYELKDNNPPIQFLELCIYKLLDGGKCIIVLPYGELFFGSSYKKSRQYFLDTIDITHIILVPSGVFTHTGIKTCIMVFSKTDKGTKEITFLKTNKECSELVKITSIKREDIDKEPNLSFYHRDYLNDEYITELAEKMPDFEWVEFGKVFTLEKGKLQSSKVEEDDNGEAVFINLSKNGEYKKIKEHTIDGENIFVSNTSPLGLVQYYKGKCNYSDLLLLLNLNNNYDSKINKKWIYYYLKSIKEHIENNYNKGSCNQSLDQKNFNRMKVPIPIMEIQKELVSYVDSIEEDKKTYQKLIDNNINKINIITKKIIQYNVAKDQITKRKFGDVCKFLGVGKRKSSDAIEDGKYPLHYCSINKTLLIDEYDFDGEGITMNITNGSGRCNVFYSNGKYSVAESTLHFTSSNADVVRPKYIYLYMKLTIESLERLYKGSQQYSIKKEDLTNKYSIIFPPLDEQDRLIDLVNQIDDLNSNYGNKLNSVNRKIKSIFLDILILN